MHEFAIGPSRRIALPRELDRHGSKADVVTSHMTPGLKVHGLALLWQNLAIDWRNWIPESDFQ
jgi:hypothetical protein